MEDRYVMLVDENGQPYLAHALNLRQRASNAVSSVKSAGTKAVNTARSVGNSAVNTVRSTASRAGTGAGRGVRAVHKYIMKIGDGAQARYLYTQDEVKAYMNAAQRQAQAAANKAKREAASKAAQAKKAMNQAKDAAKSTGEKAVNSAKNAGKKASDLVKETGRKAVETVKDKAGVDERQRAEEAWSKVPKQLSSKDEKGMQAFKEANKAQEEYRNTPLGRAEYVAERAKEIATGVDGSPRDIAEKAGNAVKSKYDRIRDDFHKKEEERAEKKAERKPVFTYQEKDKDGNVTKEEHGVKALGELAKAGGQVAGQVAKNKAEETVAKTKMAVGNAVDKVDNAVDKAVDKVTDAAYDAADVVKQLKSAADAKQMANKYRKQAEKLDKQINDMRRANNWESSPEIENLLKEQQRLNSNYQQFAKEAKKKFGFAINQQFVFGKRMY